MIVFKSMFNDVSLGEKSSSGRCVHAEDGGELPRLPACLRSGGGTPPGAPSLADGPDVPSTGGRLARHWERLCPGLRVGAEETPPGH